MKLRYLHLLLLTFVTLTSSHYVFAQAPKRASPSSSSSAGTRKSSSRASSVNFRLMANYDLVMTSPGDLNNFHSNMTWGASTHPQGTFNNMNGFSLGAGFLAGPGFLGLEFNSAIQELPSTQIIPTSSTIQDTLDYQTVYAVYDWVNNLNANSSYELGMGVGYALKYQYHWVLTAGATTEDVIWQANPMVFKVRANYNYHFSDNVRLRAGATYEYATSTNLKASASHPTVGTGIVSDQPLRYATGQDVKVDISGLRLNVGLVVAF